MNAQIQKSDSQIAIPGRAVARSQSKRSRRVRMSYPAALVELALLLCGTFGALRATSDLGIGKSTLYRWRNAYRTAWTPRYRKGVDGRPNHWTEVADELYARCEKAGFPIRRPALRAAGDHINSTVQITEHFAPAQISFPAELPNASEAMIRAKSEIDRNYASKQSIDRLAELVSMTRFRFVKKFTSTFGVSPYRYLLGVRFQRAVAMLEYSQSSLAAVAAETGFGNAASMQYAFKRFAGMSAARLMNTIAPKTNAGEQPTESVVNF